MKYFSFQQRTEIFSRTIVCLADRAQFTVPTSADKMLLRNNLLGEKKVAIPTNASKERVKEVLHE